MARSERSFALSQELPRWTRAQLSEHLGLAFGVHKTYAELTAEQQAFYLTQEGKIGEGRFGEERLKWFRISTRLIFGKSVVGGGVGSDVLKQWRRPVRFARVRGFVPEVQEQLSLYLGGPWIFIREFWKAHNLEDLSVFDTHS